MAVTSTPVKILHFCGHATKEEGIILRDERGLEDPVKLETLLAKGDPIKLVVLNACNTETTAQAIRGSVDNVIYTTRELKDDAGKLMTRVLYSELRSGKLVKDAFDAAAVAIDEAGFNAGHEEPCYKIDDKVPNTKIFDKPKESKADQPTAPTIQVENKPTYDKFFFVNYLDEQIRDLKGRLMLTLAQAIVLGLIGVGLAGVFAFLFFYKPDSAADTLQTAVINILGEDRLMQLYQLYLGKPYLDSMLAVGAAFPAVLSFLHANLMMSGNRELRSLEQMKELAKASDTLPMETQERLQKIMDQCISGADEDYQPFDWYGRLSKYRLFKRYV